MPSELPREQKLALLFEKAQRKDHVALQALCKELEGCIRGYFRQKFREPDVVDDLCQDTYLRLLKCLPAVQEPTKLRSFVVKVALHVSQDYLRKKFRRREDEFVEAHKSTMQQTENVTAAVVTESHGDVVLGRMEVQQALAQLPEKSQQIMLMMAEGYKYEEIAEVMQLSPSGVKMQIKRNLEKLRAALGSVTFGIVYTTILLKTLVEG